MSFVDERSRLPGEIYRDYIVLLVAIIGGFIPENGSLLRVASVTAIIPAMLGLVMVVYYKFIPLSWKLFVAVILSCGSYLMRWFVTWFAVDFRFTHPALLWPVWRVLFYASLLGPVAYVIPLHFVVLFFERRKLERKSRDA